MSFSEAEILFGCCSLVGFVLTYFGVSAFEEIRRLKEIGIGVTGTVEGFREKKGLGDKPVYYPTIVFETIEGKVIHFESSIGRGRPRLKVGENVSILYERQCPENVAIISELWVGPVLCLVTGIVAWGFSAYFYLRI